jgi:hypothetical protein
LVKVENLDDDLNEAWEDMCRQVAAATREWSPAGNDNHLHQTSSSSGGGDLPTRSPEMITSGCWRQFNGHDRAERKRRRAEEHVEVAKPDQCVPSPSGNSQL